MNALASIDGSALAAGLFGIAGLAIGSFVNVLIHRLPGGLLAAVDGPDWRGILWGRSRCPACRSLIRWRDNIPLLGWLMRGGRCRDCRARISWRYPLIEALLGIAAVLIGMRYGASLAGLSALALSAWLLALAAIDQASRLLPDSLTLSGLWLGLLVATGGVHVSATQAVLGAALGYLLLAGLNGAFRLLRGRNGMGGGDFKLLAMLGAWLGPAAMPVVMLLAAGGGSLYALLSGPARGRGLAEAIAFGPWLAMAGWITLIWPDGVAS